MTRRDDPPPHDVRGGDRYVLRSLDAREIRRLEGQHRVWRALVLEVLEEAGFGRGDVVLDLGCGPGYLAAELAHVVGPEGRVTGIDSSGHFIAHLEDLAHRESTPWLTGVVGDVRNRWAEPGTLDGVTCRWVLMFVEGAERVLARVAEALRPGGVFLGMEYFDFRASALHPVGEAFATTFDAVHAQISAAGGDPDVGGRLPGMVRGHGPLRPAERELGALRSAGVTSWGRSTWGSHTSRGRTVTRDSFPRSARTVLPCSSRTTTR